jgi:uncharacterized protein DUF4167
VDFNAGANAGSRLGKAPPGQSRGKSGVVEQQAMRNGQQHHHNKRMRGRNNNNNNNNNRRSHNPLTRVYESNGPDVKIRGTANHVAEKYLQLARDAQSSGDPVSAENYFQHAEHYFRLIAAANEQFRQQNPNFQPQRPEGGGGNDQQFQQRNDESFEDGDDGQPFAADQAFGTREPQPYIPPNAQPFVQRDNQPYQPRDAQPPEVRNQPRLPQPEPGNVDTGLPAFITGGAPQPQPPQSQNGYDTSGGQPDRYPLHRRRRRHRGPRDHGGPQGGDRPDDSGGA